MCKKDSFAEKLYGLGQFICFWMVPRSGGWTIHDKVCGGFVWKLQESRDSCCSWSLVRSFSVLLLHLMEDSWKHSLMMIHREWYWLTYYSCQRHLRIVSGPLIKPLTISLLMRDQKEAIYFCSLLWKTNHMSLLKDLLVQFLNDVLQDVGTSYQQVMQDLAD